MHTLISILLSAGEIPVSSLELLGSAWSWRDLVAKLSKPQDFCHPAMGKHFRCRLLQICGRAETRTIRFYRGALELLAWLEPEGYRYYMDAFEQHHFRADWSHVDRHHRVSEALILCRSARILTRQEKLPQLQKNRLERIVPSRPCFYSARAVKSAEAEDMNKTKFARHVGALFAWGQCWCIYNTRAAMMKWNGGGELKHFYYLKDICRASAGIHTLDSCILIGKDYEIALQYMEHWTSNFRQPDLMCKLYPQVHFLPLNRFGSRLLKLMTQPGWKEVLLDLLYEPEIRVDPALTRECEAQMDGGYSISFLDGDIGKLLRFRIFMEPEHYRYEVVCFPEQVAFLRKVFDNTVTINCLAMDLVEQAVMEVIADRT